MTKSFLGCKKEILAINKDRRLLDGGLNHAERQKKITLPEALRQVEQGVTD